MIAFDVSNGQKWEETGPVAVFDRDVVLSGLSEYCICDICSFEIIVSSILV